VCQTTSTETVPVRASACSITSECYAARPDLPQTDGKLVSRTPPDQPASARLPIRAAGAASPKTPDSGLTGYLHGPPVQARVPAPRTASFGSLRVGCLPCQGGAKRSSGWANRLPLGRNKEVADNAWPWLPTSATSDRRGCGPGGWILLSKVGVSPPQRP
jgi:hypothetical protein